MDPIFFAVIPVCALRNKPWQIPGMISDAGEQTRVSCKPNTFPTVLSTWSPFFHILMTFTVQVNFFESQSTLLKMNLFILNWILEP